MTVRKNIEEKVHKRRVRYAGRYPKKFEEKYKEHDPEKIEKDLLKTFDKKDWVDVNHLFVWHGRYTCIARSPKCNICPISKYCNEYKSKNNI